MTELAKLFLEEINKFTGGKELHSETFANRLDKIAITHLGQWEEVCLDWVKEGDLRMEEIRELKLEREKLRKWVKRLLEGCGEHLKEEIKQYFKQK